MQVGLLLCLAAGAANARAGAVSPWPARFYAEILTPRPTRWTPAFDAYHRGFYAVDKRGLLAALPVYARARGVRLRALLVLGPVGVLWSYDAFTFVEERGRIRVVEIQMPHARIVRKRAGWITRGQLEKLERTVRSSSVVSAAASADDLPRGRHAEYRYTFLFADFRDKAPLAFADLEGASDRGAVRTLLAPLDTLDRKLDETYTIDLGPDLRPSERSWQGGAIGLAATLAGDESRELARALQQAGYSTLTTTQLQLGPAVALWYRHWTFGGSIDLGLSRSARGPEGTRFSIREWGSNFYGGYALIDTLNLVAFPALELGAHEADAGMDPRAPPFFSAHYFGAGKRIDIRQESFMVGASLGSDYEVPFRKRLAGRWGVIFGTRLGYVRGFPLPWSDADGQLDGGPRVSGSGAFARFWVGLVAP